MIKKIINIDEEKYIEIIQLRPTLKEIILTETVTVMNKIKIITLVYKNSIFISQHELFEDNFPYLR